MSKPAARKQNLRVEIDSSKAIEAIAAEQARIEAAPDAQLDSWRAAQKAAHSIAALDKIKLNPELSAKMRTVTDYLDGKA